MQQKKHEIKRMTKTNPTANQTKTDYRQIGQNLFHAKEDTLSNPQLQQKKQPQKKDFHKQTERNFLKYLRFRCLDIQKTIEFYQSLGKINFFS